MGKTILAAAAPLLLFAVPAGAQEMDHSGHQMDHSAHADPASPTPAEEPAPIADDHPAHAGHTMAPAVPADPSDEPGNAPAPPVPTDHSADAIFGADAMRGSREDLLSHGRWRGSALIVDRLEWLPDSPRSAFAWDVTGWTGGDIDRLVLTSEGEGEFGGDLDRAELGAKWRHAVDPYANLQVGVRHDFRPRPTRTYALIGIDALAPYWIEVEAQLLLSSKGDLHARLSAEHDWRLAGPLVVNFEAESDIAFQDVPDLGVQAGIERIEAGARLRYEIRPEFAPYVGVSWERAYGSVIPGSGDPADRGRGLSAVVGLRAFF